MMLRPYQQESLDAISSALAEQPVQNRLLVKKPTGTGKTVTFAALPQHLAPWLAAFPGRQRRMLVIAHREELLDQAAEKLKAANPDLLVCVEQGNRRASVHADIVVASIQTLAAMRFRRLQVLLAAGMVFRVVVVDEAHHAAASSYRVALAHLGFLPPVEPDAEGDLTPPSYTDITAMQRDLREWDTRAPKDRVLIGVTATPNRTDAIGLGCVFQRIVYSYDLRQAIEDHWLVPIRALAIETDTSLDDVRMVRGDFAQGQLAETVNSPKRNALAVTAWQEHAAGRPTLAFTVDVAHAHDLAEAFQHRGVDAYAISGETPKERRRELLRAYQDGEIPVITNCMILTEGTDLPRTACILHAKPTRSATLYEQMTGRGLRLFPAKADCLVIDMVDVASKHSLMTTPMLYGLPPGLVVEDEVDLEEFEDAFAQLREEFPTADLAGMLAGQRLTLAELRARAVAIDVWTVRELAPEFIGDGRRIKWLRLSDDAYSVSYPWESAAGPLHETIVVSEDLVGQWGLTLRARATGSSHTHEQALIRGLATCGEAAQVAEAWLSTNRTSIARMKAVDAPWMAKPASRAQLAYLARLKVSHPPDITSGRASELIDMANHRRPR